MKIYIKEERDFLIGFVPGHSYREIVDEFNRVFNENLTVGQVKSFIANNKLNTGRTGRFEKGHVPANKGKRVSEDVYKKAAPTMFKDGHIPVNTLPIGTEKMLADGYIWVKINDVPRAKKSVNWRQKHKLVWEKQNGAIPDGCIVTFLDGDRTNCNIENLAVITRNENARMNQNGLHTEDKELTRTGIAVAKLMCKRAKRKK